MTNDSCESVVGVLDQVASHHGRSQHPDSTDLLSLKPRHPLQSRLGSVSLKGRTCRMIHQAHHKGRSMQSTQKQQLEKYNTRVLHLFTKTELREFAADCAPLDGEDTGTMNKEPLVAMLSQ